MASINDIKVKPDMSIRQVLKHMDEKGEKTIFVVNNTDEILGTVTDGDIRRWILKGGSLNKRISKAMNRNPVFLKRDYAKEEAKNKMVSEGIECIPIVDDNKKIVSAVWWPDLFDNNTRKYKLIDIPVVIMAGGEGTRLLPFTNVLPKPLMPVGEKPMIELIINKFVEFGCRDFYLSVNHKANILKAYFRTRKYDYNVKYRQETKPLGTIGSLYLFKDVLEKTFFVSNCDIIIEADYADLLKFHKDSKNKITIVVSTKHYTIPYGICEIKNGGTIKKIREKPEYDFLVNTGLYLVEPEVLQDIPKNTFYDMTNLISSYINKGKKMGIYPVSEKSWFDMGQWQEPQNIFKRFVMK